MDIFSKFGLFVCFNSTVGSVDTLVIHLNFTGDVCILSEYNPIVGSYNRMYHVINMDSDLVRFYLINQFTKKISIVSLNPRSTP